MKEVNRRAVLAGMGAGALGASGCVANGTPAVAEAARPAAKAARGDKPLNILMIVTDQETNTANFPDGLMAYLPGHRELLARGTHVTNYHVHTTPCSPSRSNIYTGQHTQKTGLYENTNTLESATLPTDMATLGGMLDQAGYYTAYKGKWHLSSINGARDWNQEVRRQYPNTRDALKDYGFADYGFDGESVGLTWAGHIDDHGVAADASALIREFAETDKTGGKPWFMAVNYVNPHDIMFYDATRDQWRTRLAPDFISPLKSEPGTPLYGRDLGFPLPDSYYADDLSTKPEAHRAITRINVATYGEMPRSDEASWQRFQNYYYNCIRDVDQHILSLLWALENSGQLDNTIIVYTSDHGERAGAHGMRQKGGTVYREETNVPMIVCHPDVAGGRTTQSLMGAVDIAPTLLGLAGKDRAWVTERFPDLVGIDVSPIIAHPDATTLRDERGHLFNLGVVYTWAREETGRYDLSKRRLHRGVFDGRYKFARYFAPGDHHLPRTFEELAERNDLELYDTLNDRNELKNLALNPERVRAELERLNAMTNALIETEIGRDEGQEYAPLGGGYRFTRA